jgi:hypothetical protein
MEYSTEIRWFFKKDSMQEIEKWFRGSGKFLSHQPERSDYYLSAGALLTHGIKIREGKFEVKIRQHDWGQISLPNNNTGKGNMWCKYSFALKEDEEVRHVTDAFKSFRSVGLNKDWIRVDKKRMVVRYLFDPDNSSVSKVTAEQTPAQGCNVEFTTVAINHGQVFCTFGFEAYGKGVDVKRNLDLTLAAVFSELNVTGLGMENSFSYPEFIFKGCNMI